MEAFKKLDNGKRKITLHITGGEPFLDVANFYKVLDFMTKEDFIDNIRIDTNASVDITKFYKDIDLPEIDVKCKFGLEKINGQDCACPKITFVVSTRNIFL